jgi:thioredoxin 1
MPRSLKLIIVLALAGLTVAAIALKDRPEPPTVSSVASDVEKPLPKLLDLGAGKCIPCKMMKPILDELKRDYADKFVTEFIDVWEDASAGEKHGIKMIPTQIFYDANGKELFRHEGFYGKEEILGKWRALGVKL